MSRKGLLAIAAVVDVAVHSNARPVSAKALAVRHALPPRHLEPVLQSLVRNGILRGIRGPQGGYQLARDGELVTAEDIIRSAEEADYGETPVLSSKLVNGVVKPSLETAERSFATALREITVAEMARRVAQPA